MQPLTIYDHTADDSRGNVRGGGRIISILRENLGNQARFVSNLQEVSPDDILLIPIWQPFQRPPLSKKIARKQILMLFDVIPLKYPEHFPIGLRGRWWLMQNIRSLSVFDQIITISKQSKDDIIDYFNLDPSIIEVVYPTTSKIFFSQSSKKGRDEIIQAYNLPKKLYCTYVGDTNWNKNLLTLAQGVIEARINCVCVGKTFSIIEELRQKDSEEQHDFFSTSEEINHPEQREFKEFIKLVLYDGHFIFPGYVPDEDLKTIYKNALCNILISRDEGFGLSYLESARQKCPSILSSIPVFQEIAGTAAYYIDPEKPHELAQQLASLIHKPRSYISMKEKAFAQSEKFSPKVFTKALQDLVEARLLFNPASQPRK